MTYFNNIIKLLFHLPQGVVISLIIISLFFNYKLIQLQSNLDYKIYNFTYTITCVILYITLFIGLIIALRYYTWGHSIAIFAFLDKIKHLFTTNKLCFILLINIWLNVMICLIKIRKCLIKQILKLNLYITGIMHFSKKYKKPGYISDYERYFGIFKNRFSYQEVIMQPLRYRFIRLIVFYYKWINKKSGEFVYNKHVYLWEKYFKTFLSNIPLFILIILFFFDIIINNGNITNIFYYLPFYFIYTLWYNISYFICNTRFSTNEIIWERYYDEEFTIYSNTTEEEDLYFLEYIANGFIPISLKNDDIQHFIAFEALFIYNRRFLKDSDFPKAKIYTNPNTNEMINGNIKSISSIEIDKITIKDLKKINKKNTKEQLVKKEINEDKMLKFLEEIDNTKANSK